MKRLLYVDVIRIWACIMITAMHAPIPRSDWNSYLLAANSLLTAPSIGLYIMVSGALVLPVSMPTKDFLKRRTSKIVYPTLIWTTIYYIVAPFTYTVSREEGMLSFLSIPFSVQFNPSLWFMYMLVGLYLLAPILSAWLQKASKREVELYLGLWAITMCYPILRYFIYVNEGVSGIFYYFGGYVGYFILGYYLKRYAIQIVRWKIILLLSIPIGLAVVMKVMNVSVDFYDLFWYMSILIAMMSVGWFLLIRQCSPQYNAASKTHRVIVIISNCCFGIYLSHILVMRGLLWHWDVLKGLDGVIQIAVTTLLTFACSLLFTYLVSWLPGAAYIVGIKHKKK